MSLYSIEGAGKHSVDEKDVRALNSSQSPIRDSPFSVRHHFVSREIFVM